MEGYLGVRKGAWTEEEDNLLRTYVEKYGEKKCHQIPVVTGLNRCRKSCRLRWLNYLRPTIKRGAFAADEVDLILRLHKLLGNRWSLIAGRLPGRTANDLKNYWNTHLRKKSVFCNKNVEGKAQKTEYVNIIKPRPRRLSKNLQLMKSTTIIGNFLDPRHDNGSMWWESLFAGSEFDQAVGTFGNSGSMATSGWELTGNVWSKRSPPRNDMGDSSFDEAISKSFWNDFSFDEFNIWNL